LPFPGRGRGLLFHELLVETAASDAAGQLERLFSDLHAVGDVVFRHSGVPEHVDVGFLYGICHGTFLPLQETHSATEFTEDTEESQVLTS